MGKMQRQGSRGKIVLCAALAAMVGPCSLAVHAQTPEAATVGRKFYVDCDRNQADGAGRSPQSAWNSLARLNAATLEPGDVVALKRGTTCKGTLAPKGSGSEAMPIRLTAYGEGPRPRVIAGDTVKQSLLLFDQQYWDIDSLDLSGGNTYGVFVSGTKGVLHYIHLSNLLIHDVMGEKLKTKDCGLLLISPGSVDQHFEDVVIDNVSAWHTNQWAGIMVGGGNLGYPPEEAWNVDAVIRNSTVHDVQGDGIVLFRVHHGSIESSVAWNTGMQVTETNGTPNAIWTWMCDDCTVRGSEAYLTDSPGVDGGAFDIDYDNTQNAVLDSYGHDTQGYCVSVFGAGFTTRQSIVRGNLCIDNARSPRMADYQGAIYLLTWNNGKIDGLTIENNTVFWNPVERVPALLNDAAIKEGSAVFRNNTIYSTSPWLVDSHTSLGFEGNHYRLFTARAPEWRVGGRSYNSAAALQGAKLEGGGEAYSHALEQWGAAYGVAAGSPAQAKAVHREKIRLTSTIPVRLSADGLLNDEALQQLTVLKSFAAQYVPLGLEVDVVFSSPRAELFRSTAFRNAVGDLSLREITTSELTSHAAQRTVLSMMNSTQMHQWRGLVGPVELGLALRGALGDPVFSQMEDQR